MLLLLRMSSICSPSVMLFFFALFVRTSRISSFRKTQTWFFIPSFGTRDSKAVLISFSGQLCSISEVLICLSVKPRFLASIMKFTSLVAILFFRGSVNFLDCETFVDSF